ncbi:MAG: valine--tRNA ligase [Rhodanobacteraceae bacterium]|nr:MAG: valine--tRNA ligase [Rhodanobacteraceae bacterium]
MDKSFDPKEIESKWYKYWEDAHCFEPTGKGEPYCILLPPPNVTGTLHMGHAFQQTIMDALIRHARMSGKNTLWQGGTDHAGIATQKIVENQLAAEGKTRHDLGREKFVERVWQWKQESGNGIYKQMRRLGASVDWSRERFTMDEGLSAAVRRVFVEWYRAGLIYRGNRLVNWDPVLMTAVSDLEVNNVERDGHLWSIRYDVIDPQPGAPDHVVIATTRPETMLGDVAVAVHPEDERYTKLVGRKLMLPLANREIPIIADDYVDREFGTGAVKITPAHDFNDYTIWERHVGTGIFDRMPARGLICIFTLDAHVLHPPKSDELASGVRTTVMNQPHEASRASIGQSALEMMKSIYKEGATLQVVPQAYRGLDRFDARKRIVADLEAEGRLVETKPHKLQVPVSQRSDAVIEPMLTDQWFVDLTSQKGRKAITQPALDAVRNGDIRFVPENWTTTYTQWLDNIQDWCISRQLWWGHRIPAWYDEADNIFVGEDEADARAHASTQPVGPLRQDEDVLDTWFSSALWPFSTLGWPSNDPVRNERGETVANWPRDKIFLPSAVLVTGFDIIFFWVARMVMTTLYFTGRREDGSYEPDRADPRDRVPFREVYINAIVRDAEGQKMSKSKGNTLDPLDLIDGITLPALVEKSTKSLLIPQVREKVEKRIRKEYPEGITAIGTDALRFTFAALASYSRTINFDIKRAEGYKAFCNKLWNAARFVLMNTEGFIAHGEPELRTAAEKWIYQQFWDELQAVADNFRTYRFDLLAQDLYQFVWNEYCDWFVELAKIALNGADAEDARSTRHTLLYMLEAALRALHPVIPFITEEIWQSVAPRLSLTEDSILERVYPRIDAQPEKLTGAQLAEFQAHTRRFPQESTQIGGTLIPAAIKIRSLRSGLGVSPNRMVPLLVEGDIGAQGLLGSIAPMLRNLCNIDRIEMLPAGTPPPPSAAAPMLGAVLHIPLEGLIDLDAERARLKKEIARIEGEIRKCEGKLGNANFVDHAPAAVVEQERVRLADWNTQLDALRGQADRLSA